ncbi:MAG: TonB-dependent receptor [Candidatus Symbiothrix sp.]|jgi:outer membrane receptor for ferrienterochelin and colicins|nr:TonB-dependent receptor [Candidatus Symbiothrix sp.]
MTKLALILIGLLFTSSFSFAQNAPNPEEITGDSIKERDYYLDEVVVTGTLTARTLKNTPVLTKVISGNDILQSGATTVLEALENFVPGVNFTPNPMGDNIQIAGLDNKYILILVDGERLVNERTENVNFSRLNTYDIKKIEIINGASSVLYGSNAIGAVINVITKDVDKPVSGSARVRYSDYNSFVGDASFGFKINRFSSKTVFSAKNSDGYSIQSKPNENGEVSRYTMYPYSDYTLSQVFKYKQDKLDVEMKGSYYNSETWFLHKYQTRVDENYTMGGKLQYTFSETNALTFTGNRDTYDGHQIYKLRNDSSDYVNGSKYTAFRLVDAWDVTEKIQLISGAEMNLENTFSYNQFGFDPGEKDASNWNLFSQGEFKTETGLEALIGVRYTQHSQFGGYLSPKISLMYRLENFRFRGNISNGYKAPTLKELYMNFPHKIGEDIPFWVIGNADLIPEESWYKSLSAEYIANDLNMSVTVHDNAIKNKINTNQIWNEGLSRTEMQYENVEDAQITGVDVSLQWTFLKDFQLKGGYSFANAVDKATNRQLSGNSKHTGTVNVVYKRKHLPFLSATETPYSLLLSGRMMSPRIFYSTDSDSGEITEDSTGSYFISRFVYTQQFPVYKRMQGDLQVGINNLLNYTNRDFLANNPGRTYFVSLGIRF